jgi:perosamine synthetase
MNVPLAVPNLGGREAEYLQECVESTFVSSAGPFVGRFQDRIAEISGTERSVVTCSGTVALQMALEGLGIGAGDLVMVPSLTFIASTNAIRHSGAAVWLVDSTPTDWTMDLDVARRVIESETEPHPRGRRHLVTGEVLTAIMPVMTMVATLDFESSTRLAREYGLKVVVDAAAAIGARGLNDELLGATGVDAVCYSFNGNKTVTSGGGGAVAAADTRLVERVDHLISTGRVGSNYEHDVVAYNFRMTNVEAAIGVAQLERLPQFLERKRQVFERYAELAERFENVAAFPTPVGGRSTHWFSGLVYTGDDIDQCTAFRAHMVARGVDVRPFWKPVHLQLPYLTSLRTEMDVAEHLWDRILPLPCSTGISDEELDYVVRRAAEFWERSASGNGDG